MNSLSQVKQLAKLSAAALVAFTCRCARRVQAFYGVKFRVAESPIDLAISSAEDWAASGKAELRAVLVPAMEEAYRMSELARKYAWEERDDAYDQIGDTATACYESYEEFWRAADAAQAAALAANAAVAASEFRMMECEEAAQKCMKICLGLISDAIFLNGDYDLLLQASMSGIATHGHALLDREFFSTRSTFDVDSIVGGQSSLQIASIIGQDLIRCVGDRPCDVYNMTPREFEEFVAHLLDGLGYEVTLTRRTRDNGYDIIAIENSVFSCKYLVECKRYRSENKVDVGAVRQLHGVVSGEKATKGILVTTSTFTSPAQHHIDEHKWILEGRDYQGLLDWLDRYQLYQLGFRD